MNTGETIALIKAFGGGGSSLPPVTPSDNGKVLAVEDGAWAASERGKKFLVTLTPTALDYSGTMDKTVAEIAAAYNAGQEIWFRIMMSSNAYVETPLTYCLNDGMDYPGFGTQAIEFNNGVLIVARIPSTNDGTTQTYSTTVYALTPAS